VQGILILGGGGHGRVIADILLSRGIAVQGFLDDNRSLWGTSWYEIPVLGEIDQVQEFSPAGMIVGVGRNDLRMAIVERLAGRVQEDLWANAIHPRATVAASAQLGRGIVVAAGAVINPNAIIGDHAIINTVASVDHDCVIGDFAHLAPGVHLSGGVVVGEGTLLGVGSSVIPSRSIGTWVTIGSGAAVVQDVPDGVVAKGIPAQWV
jgi:sugar O-acyltransferase (sialic acid O-acetyltransferase NeuD family)